MTTFWWVAAIAAGSVIATVALYRKRPAPHPHEPLVFSASPEPPLPSAYHTACEIEVFQEPCGSFQVCSTGGTVVNLNGAAAKQVHRWCAPHGCRCTCTKEDEALTGYEIFSVVGGAYALKEDTNAPLIFDLAAAMKFHIFLRPASCPCECPVVPVRVLR
jgi:hypothetical protein